MAGPAPSGLVWVATCLDICEAQVLRSRLDAAGIPVFLFNEHITQTAWQFVVAVGGVRVMVPAVHAADVDAILAADAVAADVGLGEKCPDCGAGDVARLFSWAGVPLTVLPFFVTALPVSVHRRRRKCRACRRAWRV
ncbi:MAG: DUF2007 domain-containing protein [Alphaproteobacteria bacterium]|nr:DUF2007 domain-containing protein [Alphaproteobacteria bacterium]